MGSKNLNEMTKDTPEEVYDRKLVGTSTSGSRISKMQLISLATRKLKLDPMRLAS